jgi:DNA-binding transcriptional ArsR family regulator
MITFNLKPDDLKDIRFSYSPLVELVTSYRVFSMGKEHKFFRRWVQDARRDLLHADLRYLDAVVSPVSNVPDFITPVPSDALLNIDEELEKLRETPDDKIREDILKQMAWKGESDILQSFLMYPHESLEKLIEDLRVYWQRALSPHWSRIVSVLEGDILYRARRMALQGADAIFDDLHPSIDYAAGQIILSPHKAKVGKGQPSADKDIDLTGSGLQLVPAIFSGRGILWQVEEASPSMLIYGARGSGVWQQDTSDEEDQSLELALGTGRAKVLQVLATPSNTGEVARRLQISSGAVSQHLSRLRNAGLVEPHRNGKRVYYHLTDRGEQLLALFAV